MKIFRLRTVWEKLARKDPLWAVLTDPAKRGNRWQRDDFFQTGRDEIDAWMAWLHEHAPTAVRRDALDFGCGVGRLSQALARHYARVTAIDISKEMIALARRYCPSEATIAFLHNPHAHLHIVPDASQDLVLSHITLQHVPPELIAAYLREFVRTCRPGAHIVFQLPTFVPPREEEIKRFSYYPPTLWKRIRRWTGHWFRSATGIGDGMHMTALPEADVRELLRAAGAHVLAAKAHPIGDGCRSLVYLARRGAL
jgi:ubiquinone/menaquinone biosynthesis C-methylase UbiE